MTIRFRVARALDKLPRTCWPDLYDWYDGRRPLRDCFRGPECKEAAAVTESRSCWCGKFRPREGE